MKEIKDFPGYFITEDGRVYSKKRDKFLKTRKAKGGYLRVTLSVNCKLITRLVHQLVIEAYGPACPGEGYTVDHINRVRTDNRIENLRWANNIEQQANRTNTRVNYSVQVVVEDIFGNVREYKSMAEAGRAIGRAPNIVKWHLTKGTPTSNGYMIYRKEQYYGNKGTETVNSEAEKILRSLYNNSKVLSNAGVSASI